MASPLNTDQKGIILSLIARSPEGVSLDQIASMLTPAAEPRILQQWLNDLVEDELVLAQRLKGGPRYVAVDKKILLALSGKLKPGSTPVDVAGEPSAIPVGPLPSPVSAAVAGAVRATSPSAPVPSYTELFATLLPPIILKLMPKASAAEFLQNQATARLGNVSETKAFVAYSLARLDLFTVAEAVAYGISVEQFGQWRDLYGGGSGRLAWRQPELLSGSGRSGSPSASGVSAPAGRHASSVTPAVVGNVRRETSTTEGAVDVGRVGQRDAGGEGRLAKRTITRMRVIVAVIWGVVVVIVGQSLIKKGALHVTAASARQFAMLAQLGGLATIPVAGLPWLLFHWRDQAETTTKPNLLGLVMMLVLGGIVTVVIGKVIVVVLVLFML